VASQTESCFGTQSDRSLLNVHVFGSQNVPAVPGFPEYMADVSSRFCPYIEPSAAKNETTYTVVSSNTADKRIAEKIVFASAYALSELLRHKRARASSGRRIPLMCENAIFLFPQIDDAMGKELLGWPHWVLKCRYTQLGLLFGKFWKGAQEKSKDDRDLPVPPCNLFSVRESVRARDPQFFARADWLLPSLESSNDLGQNVFSDLVEHQEIADMLGAFCAKPEALSFIQIITALVQSSFYERAKELAAAELEARKRRTVN
jgi:hypothetical protein